MDRIRELEYFVCIAKHQRIGKAAQELNVSQPTLSKFVQKIESRFGLPLFYKLGNHFLLTYAGKRFLETAETILRMKKNLYYDLSSIEKENIDELKIGMSVFRGQCILPQILPLFRDKYPNVKINIFEANSYHMEQMVLEGELDIAFVVMPSKNPDISYEVLAQEEIVLLMSLDHPQSTLACKKKGFKYPWIDIKKLKDEQFILLWSDQRTRKIADRIFHEADIYPHKILTTRNIMTSIELAINGYGMAFSGELPLYYYRLNEKLNIFSVGQKMTLFNLSAIHRSGVRLSLAAEDFITLVRMQVYHVNNLINSVWYTQ